MPNPEHLEILKHGATEWNEWRVADHPDVTPDLLYADLSKADLSEADLSGAILAGANLSGADLSGAKLSVASLKMANISKAKLKKADLSGAKLSGADLSGAILIEADLSGAKLSGADLGGADLSGADLSGAILIWADLSGADLSGAKLSGAVVNEHTNYGRAIGCIRGVNGFYVEKTDSAALMTLTPPGDSMKGANANAVVDSLKQARGLHVFSMTLAAFVFYIAVLKPNEIKLPLIDDKIPSGKFGLFAMPFSICFLTLVATFMFDAIQGARYLQSRDDAMKVGQFPWALSRFSGKSWPHKLLSYLTRFVMAFHPLVYLFFLFGNRWLYPKWVFIVFGVVLSFLSGWVFFISQLFQRPILFDRKTEEGRQSDLARLAKSVEEQTKTMTKLIDLLEPTQSLNTWANNTEIRLKDSPGEVHKRGQEAILTQRMGVLPAVVAKVDDDGNDDNESPDGVLVQT